MRARDELRLIRNDTRAGFLWWIAKAIFGVLVVVGVNNANEKLDELAATSTNQKLDHQTIEDVKQTQAQMIDTLKTMSVALQSNTTAIKLNNQTIQSLNERQAKDDDFRETHSNSGLKKWTH